MKAYLETEDVKRLEETAITCRDRLLIRLLFRSGCRVSEALALKVGDIDFERGTVTILHLKTRIRLSCIKCRARLGKRRQFCPECGEEVSEAQKRQQEHRRVRVLPVDKHTLEMLKDYVGRDLLTSYSGSTLLFGLNRHRAWQIVRDCAKRVGLPDLVNPETGRMRGVSPHRLRDAFAVNAMKLDETPETHYDCFKSIWDMLASIQRLGIERSPVRNIASGMKGFGAKPPNSQRTHYKLLCALDNHLRLGCHFY